MLIRNPLFSQNSADNQRQGGMALEYHTSHILITYNETSRTFNKTFDLLLDPNTTTSSHNASFDDVMWDKFIMWRLAWVMNKYYLWCIFLLGFPGNMVSFVTVLRMTPWTSPTGYVAALALVDNACLTIKVISQSLTSSVSQSR